MRTLAGAVLCLVVGCANNVAQDRSTGPDGRQKGARPLELAEGEAKDRDIVTYPGGDRVDWKRIELPANTRGRLDVQLSFTTPRPGLKVAFDVFDQWNVPVVKANASRGRTRSVSIDSAKGIYFVRVYAPRRGDAGAYQLKAEFTPDRAPDVIDWPKVEIPEPPRLADVPPPPVEPDVSTTTPPPAPPTPPTPPPTDVVVTPPPPVAKPVAGRVLKSSVTPDGIEVTIAVGSQQGVTTDWKARSLRGETASPLSGGTGKILRVNKNTTVVRLSLTKDVVDANPRVELSP